MRLVLALVIPAFAAAPAFALPGEDAFNDVCSSCHTVDPPSITAPALRGVVGR